MVEYILKYVCVFLAIFLVLPFHEFAHAFTAVKCGDNTPKLYGRCTLNPLKHFDPVGTVCFVIFGFGWAKPVPINPNNFKHSRRDSVLVALSGVFTNYLMAFLIYPLFILSTMIPSFWYLTAILQNVLWYAFTLNLAFFLFNLIPIYPLDGFRAVEAITKKRGKFYEFLRTYGIYILFFFFAFNIVADVTGIKWFGIFDMVMSKATSIIKVPITAFWGLIF